MLRYQNTIPIFIVFAHLDHCQVSVLLHAFVDVNDMKDT